MLQRLLHCTFYFGRTRKNTFSTLSQKYILRMYWNSIWHKFLTVWCWMLGGKSNIIIIIIKENKMFHHHNIVLFIYFFFLQSELLSCFRDCFIAGRKTPHQIFITNDLCPSPEQLLQPLFNFLPHPVLFSLPSLVFMLLL